MRPIKFRAWVYHLNKMMPVKEIDFDDFMPSVMLEINSERHEQMFFENTGYPDCELMQYTGLKDKNGKEIYEGDIVFDRWANAYTPVFQNGIYMAYNPKNLMQNDPSTQFNIIWKDGCEIIGNIYENPEWVANLIDDEE